MRKTQVYEWFAHFKNGGMPANDSLRTGRPLTLRIDENIGKIRELVLTDR